MCTAKTSLFMKYLYRDRYLYINNIQQSKGSELFLNHPFISLLSKFCLFWESS